MAYHIYLGGLEFPVVPASITTKIGNKNKSYELINLGEINRVQPAGLREFKFDLRLPQIPVTTGPPDYKHYWANYPEGFFPALNYLVHLNKLKSEILVFRMVISRYDPVGNALYDTSWDVTLEDYEVKEDTKNGFDQVAAVTLKEYRPYHTKLLTLDAPAAPAAAGTAAPTEEKTAAEMLLPPIATMDEYAERQNRLTGSPRGYYSFADGSTGITYNPKSKHVVQEGEDLSTIARNIWGDGDRWREIYAANQTMIDAANAGSTLPYYTIHPDQVLIIPSADGGAMISLL